MGSAPFANTAAEMCCRADRDLLRHEFWLHCEELCIEHSRSVKQAAKIQHPGSSTSTRKTGDEYRTAACDDPDHSRDHELAVFTTSADLVGAGFDPYFLCPVDRCPGQERRLSFQPQFRPSLARSYPVVSIDPGGLVDPGC